jgi:hypothetical protein
LPFEQANRLSGLNASHQEDCLEEPLRLLAGLAREYEQKYNQLSSSLCDADPAFVPHQLKMRAELTTDRFRAAQMEYLSKVSFNGSNAQEEGYEALLTLFRSFDEMRIVFQLLMEKLAGNADSRP